MPPSETVAIVVPVHAPPPEVVTRIADLTRQGPVVVVDDGSPARSRALLAEIAAQPGVEVLAMGGNRGIAAALNRGLTAAFAAGASAVVTFDQDSTAEPDHLARLHRWLSATDRLGVVGPAMIEARHMPDPDAIGPHDAGELLQSGMLIPRSTWEEVGEFDEDLFIDFVDHDYCLRVRRAGLRVLVDPTLTMQHRLGDPDGRQLPPIAGRHPRSSHHGPDRRYYINRNLVHMVRRYRHDDPAWTRAMVRGVVKADLLALLVDHRRAAKAKAIGQGLYDGWRGRVGRRDRAEVGR